MLSIKRFFENFGIIRLSRARWDLIITILGSSIDIFRLYQIYYAKTVHEFFDDSIEKHGLDVLEDRFKLIENIVDLRECLFELMGRMFFLYVVKGGLNIHDLEVNHVHDLFMLKV